MAIAFKSSGSGVSTETSAAALSPLCPATVDVGDILIAHVFWEGTTTAPSTPAGWDLLSGPHVIETTIARHWMFGRVADGTEDGAAVAFGNPAVTTQRAARIYSFSGRVVGPVTALVKGFAHTSNANDPTAPNVTTTKAGALAVLLVGQNDNNALASFTGESGGDYTEAVAELTANLTPGLSLGIETATPTANPGTITGGTDNTTNDPAGVIGFQILADSSEVIALGSASATASATLALTAPTQVPLGAAGAVASPTLSVFTPVPAMITGGSYEDVVLDDDPELYARMGASGLVDQSGNGRDGTGQGGLTVGGEDGLVADPDAATAFNGSQDAYFPFTPWANGSAFTFECWGIWDGTAWAGTFFGGYDPGSRPIFYIVADSGAPQFIINNSDSFGWPAGTIPAGVPFHLVFSFDEANDSGRLIIDGVDQGAPGNPIGQAGQFDGTAGPLKLGSWGGGTGGWIGTNAYDGTLDEVALYDGVLSASRVTAHFNAGTNGVPITAQGQASASLALTTPTQLPLSPAAATASATLSVLIPVPVPLDSASGASDATLALSAPTAVPLAAASATTSPTLALSAQTTIPFGASTAAASASLALSAATQVPLDPASSAASATLSLSAATGVELGGASATSSGTLAVTAATVIGLGSADAVSTATLAVTAGAATVPLDPAVGASSASLALTAPTQLPLDAASATSTASAALSAPASLIFGAASSSASATLAITAANLLILGASSALASATLIVSTPGQAPGVTIRPGLIATGRTGALVSSASGSLRGVRSGGVHHGSRPGEIAEPEAGEVHRA